MPQVQVFLTQGEKQHLKSAPNKLRLFMIGGDGSLKHLSNAAKEAGITVPNSNKLWNSDAQYFITLTITVDNTGTTPTVKYVLAKNDGTLIYESAVVDMGNQFDLTKNMGLKFVVYDEWSSGNTIELGYYEMTSKIQKSDTYSESFKVKNNTSNAISGSVISALYDSENKLVDVEIKSNRTIGKGKTLVYDSIFDISNMDSTDDFTVKHFVWNSADAMKPLGLLNTASVAPIVNCN